MLRAIPPRIDTPCVKICCLDPVSGLCLGCGRTGAEIGGWMGMSQTARQHIMAELPGRLSQLAQAPVKSPR
ncbi:MAG: DUF1289 domain-containing protein [Hyphomicrobiales bacterium]|jgi:predicted Fe-S protein YdhL (DUF1289 family)|nr:DUF1289 domain-containing protein [Hyphomicrobiales bacterium]